MAAVNVPVYGLHKPTGQARCYVNGKSVYLRVYGSKESRIRYAEIVAQVVSGLTGISSGMGSPRARFTA